MAKKILSEEFRRMQKLAGIITEEQFNENVASEMVKFVSQNFDTIKANFLQSELEMLDDIEAEEEDYSNLNSQMDVSSAEELINAINERSMGVDLEDDMDASELFDMIKELASGQLNENVAGKMMDFVKQNLAKIKANFMKSEMQVLDDIDAEEEDYDNLKSQMNVSSAQDLIDVINERTLGVDLEDDKDMSKLFNMIKKLAR
jgi:hypothetical protein